MAFKDLLRNLPEVKAPSEKKVSFGVKIKWSLIILISFFVLANIPLFGTSEGALERFEYLAILLGTSFGSIISLGIGPIVMSSIILQLLVGAQILNIDTKTEEGKKYFQGIQKLLAFSFVIFEAIVYVLMRGIEAQPGFTSLVILQLCLGGFLIIFMDEVLQKWGFGSGVSLFIAAGIGWRLFAQLFQFIGPEGNFQALGHVWAIISAVITGGPNAGISIAQSLFPIIVTIILFLVVVWAQSLKVEVPLSSNRVRGYAAKWPLKFFYASVLPVILVSAISANLILGAGLLQGALDGPTFLGNIENGQPVCTSEGCGFAFWVHSNPLLQTIITGSFRWIYAFQAMGHVLFYVLFSVIFSFFWVSTSGMDAKSQAKNIMSYGMNIPGFRRDERVLESILKRYITPLTIMGGAAIGLLASVANLFGALVGGTAILLAVMILYQLYENIAQQHALDMNPALRNFFGG